jgi:catechol 2,3-dioxygenase-like lactoylglutathione lyase family enzyme
MVREAKVAEQNPSIMSHVSIGTNDFERAIDFYDKVLAAIGARRIMELMEFGAVAYGRKFPEFWVQRPMDGASAGKANGTHFAFLAPSQEAVRAFWDAAIAAGAQADGEPGLRPHYGAGYYGCFVRDLDGHKIEAMHWDETSEAGGGA